jgi:hypothetical protein
MSQLHEVLAVIPDLQTRAKEAVDQTVLKFTKQTQLFFGMVKRLQMFDDNRKQEEAEGFESRELTSTVGEELNLVSESLSRFLNALAQKEFTNQKATSDIVLSDGTVLFKNLPATLLLTLENWLEKWREVYINIPLVEDGVVWVKDENKKDGVYRAQDDILRHKTEKIHLHKILVEPTKEHPAQIREWTEDRPIGRTIQSTWTGKIFPREKAEKLARLDDLIFSVKKARMRANTTDLEKVSPGEVIFKYINLGSK